MPPPASMEAARGTSPEAAAGDRARPQSYPATMWVWASPIWRRNLVACSPRCEIGRRGLTVLIVEQNVVRTDLSISTAGRWSRRCNDTGPGELHRSCCAASDWGAYLGSDESPARLRCSTVPAQVRPAAIREWF